MAATPSTVATSRPAICKPTGSPSVVIPQGTVTVAVSSLPRDSRWKSLSRLALRDDLYSSLRRLAQDIAVFHMAAGDADACIEDWRSSNVERIRRARAVLDETATPPRLDFPLVSVAVHQIRAMTRRHKPGRLNDSPRRIVDVSLAYIAALDMDVS